MIACPCSEREFSIPSLPSHGHKSTLWCPASLFCKVLQPCQGMTSRGVPAFNTHCPETSPDPKPLDPYIEPRILCPPGEICLGVHGVQQSLVQVSLTYLTGTQCWSVPFLSCKKARSLCALGLPFSRTLQVPAKEGALFITSKVQIPLPGYQCIVLSSLTIMRRPLK